MELDGKTIRLIKLRNPWGHNVPEYRRNVATRGIPSFEDKGETNGVFFCELTHFMQKFDAVQYSG